MNIVHISAFENSGGSAKSANRIHQAMLRKGYNSKMIVGNKESESPYVDQITTNRLEKVFQSICNSLFSLIGLQYESLPFSYRLTTHPWILDSDVVILYNTHGGYIDFPSLTKLFLLKPIIWRFSDLWPITGHCSYPGKCERWLTGCGNCPDLGTYPGVGVDMTSRLWKQKIRLFRTFKPNIIAPSSWMSAQAHLSPMLTKSTISYIPNGISLTVFTANDRSISRSFLGIDDSSVVVLFIAEKSYPNCRKGTPILQKALHLIKSKNISLLAVGHHSERWIKAVPIKVHSLGSLTDPLVLRHAYCASDFSCVPSVHENLPNTVIESLACGTPVLAFDSGGIRDGVIDMETGILCKERTPESLALSLDYLACNPRLRHRLSITSRNLAVERFSDSMEADYILESCRSALQNKSVPV